MQYYNIIRYYKNRQRNREVIRRKLTLEEAQSWCSREDTRKEWHWFDGYEAI